MLSRYIRILYTWHFWNLYDLPVRLEENREEKNPVDVLELCLVGNKHLDILSAL